MSNKALYALFAMSVVLIICLIGIVLYLNSGPKPPVTAKPVNNNPITKGQQSQQDKGVSAGNLLNKLPYRGKNFSLYYSYAKNEFTLYINPSNKDAGNKEFEEFLTSNGGLTRNWFNNLITIYKTPPLINTQ